MDAIIPRHIFEKAIIMKTFKWTRLSIFGIIMNNFIFRKLMSLAYGSVPEKNKKK